MTAWLPPSRKLCDAVLEARLQRPPWSLFTSQGSTHLLACQCCLYCLSHLGYETRSLGDSERAWELHRLLSSYEVHSVSQVASQVLVVKSLPANAGDSEMSVGSRGQKDPLEEGTATHSSVLPGRIPQRSLVGYGP